MDLNNYLLIKQASPIVNPPNKHNFVRHMLNDVGPGLLLAAGHNGIHEANVIDEQGNHVGVGYNYADPTWKSRGRQALALGLIGSSIAGCGATGYYMGKGFSKLTGLSKSKKRLAKALDYGIRGIGTLGGAGFGAIRGASVAGMLAGDRASKDAYIDAVNNASPDESDDARRVRHMKFLNQVKPW